METVQSFYSNGKSIIGFLVLVLVFNMIFDTKTTEKFVLLVLFSMCILNADKFISFMRTAFGNDTNATNGMIADNKADYKDSVQNNGTIKYYS